MSSRRETDTDGEDYSAMRSTGTPAWVKGVGVLVGTIGLPGFLLLWMLGAFHAALPSPVTATILAHDEKTTKIQRLICRGIWRGDAVMQSECDR